jgi:D-amino-acid dehydrogenase
VSAQHPTVGRVAVIGGGVIGLSTAYYLRQAGVEVVVLERDRVGSGASRGNAGEVCPGVSAPLPAPGVVSASLRRLHRRDSALYVHPQPSIALARFLLGFALSSRAASYAAGVRALGELSRDAVDQYREIAADGVEFSLNDRPYLCVFETRARAQASLAELRRWSGEFLEVPERVLDQDELRTREPSLTGGVSGYALEGQVVIDTSAYIDALAARLRSGGAEIREGTRVTRIRPDSQGVGIATTRDTVKADAAVLASGVWSTVLARTTGGRVPIFPGKGYSFSVPIKSRPTHLISLDGPHVSLAPLNDTTRIAGTMELDRQHDRFDPRRIEAIVTAARPYLQGVRWEERTAEWVGPRPMTANGLPFIGALDSSRRLFVAAGHNMLGVTLAPGTGRALARLITDGDPGLDLTPFAPARAD